MSAQTGQVNPDPSSARRAAVGWLWRGYAFVVTALRLPILLAWAAVTVWAMLHLPAIATSGGLGNLIPQNAPAARAEYDAARLFGVPLSAQVAVVQRDPHRFGLSELLAVGKRAAAVDQGRASGIAGLAAALPVSNTLRLMPGSRERSTTIITFLYFRPGTPLGAQSSGGREYARKYLSAARDHLIGVTGSVPAQDTQGRIINKYLPWVEIATILAIFVIVAAYFRSVAAALAALLSAGIAYELAIRLVAWAGQRAGMTVPPDLEPVLVVLLLGVTTDYTVFYLAGMRRGLDAGLRRIPAARRAVAEVTPIIVTAGLVVTAGIASLTVARLGALRAFGPGLALTVLIAMVVAITLGPALIGTFGGLLFHLGPAKRIARSAGEADARATGPDRSRPTEGNGEVPPGRTAWYQRLRAVGRAGQPVPRQAAAGTGRAGGIGRPGSEPAGPPAAGMTAPRRSGNGQPPAGGIAAAPGSASRSGTAAPGMAAASRGQAGRLPPGDGTGGRTAAGRARTAAGRGRTAADRRRFTGAAQGIRAAMMRLVTVRPVALLVAAACVAGLVFAAIGLSQLRLGFPLIRALPRTAQEVRAQAAASRGFAPGILAPAEVLVIGQGVGGRGAALARLQRALARQPGVAGVVGPTALSGRVSGLAGLTNQAGQMSGLIGQAGLAGAAGAAGSPAGRQLMHMMVAASGNAARYAVIMRTDPLEATAIGRVRELRHRLPALARRAGLGPVRVTVGGETALAGEAIDSVEADLQRIAIVIGIVIVILLALFLRALIAPLYLLAASVLALLSALGLTVWIFQIVLGYGSLVYYVPFVAAVLLVSLGSDYNVFVAGRIWEEARRRPLRDAVAVAAPRASRAITAAGLALAAGFGMLAIVPLAQFRELALAMALGVLIDTFIVRSLLVPSLIVLFGRAGTWPARMYREPAQAARPVE